MPELVEQMYCSQQIVIPPKFPYILKRYCKAAIKTQPYDLLRWSFEYFKALGQHRPPPVKLRLEYPVYSTEGGLTRGCLKVLANQLADTVEIPLASVRSAWQGFCLDPVELRRILCLCEVYQRSDSVLFLHFIAVAAGMLTKSLTHTMILLCETLTKEPDGGSAAIAVQDFLAMYRFLARIDASKDVNYLNGFREGFQPEEASIEEEQEPESTALSLEEPSIDDYWQDLGELQKLSLINDHVARSARLSVKLNMPILGKIERSPSMERAGQIERDNYMMETSGRPIPTEEIEQKLKALSASRLLSHEMVSKDEIEASKRDTKAKEEEKQRVKMTDEIDINVYDEDGNIVPYELFEEQIKNVDDKKTGEPKEVGEFEEDLDASSMTGAELKPSSTAAKSTVSTLAAKSTVSTIAAKSTISAMAPKSTAGLSAKSILGDHKSVMDEATVIDYEDMTPEQKITYYVNCAYQEREERREDLADTFDEIAALVDRFKSASYDLGMVAGRQMSTTSGEFIVQQIEREILAYIDEQIAVLPDPDLKKKKAKPDEVAMIRDFLENFLDENMEIIAPEIEEVEEEEHPIPEVTLVYAVPGIGPPVEDEIMKEFEEYAWDVCKVQAEVFMPRNIRHFMCPPLEKYVEYKYDDDKVPKKEEVATGAVITD